MLNIPKGTKLYIPELPTPLVYFCGYHNSELPSPFNNPLKVILEVRHDDGQKDFYIVEENVIYKNLTKSQKILFTSF